MAIGVASSSEDQPAARPAPESHDAPTPWDRLEDQLDWYDRNSGRMKRAYQRLKVSQIVIAAAIPVAAAADAPSIVPAVMGASIVVFEGVQQLFKYHDNWTAYRSTAEALKHEKHWFLASAGPYARCADPPRRLAERVERLVSTEHSTGRPPSRRAGRGRRLAGRADGVNANVATPAAPAELARTDVFVSYSRRDKAFVAGPLLTSLTGRGQEVWLDLEDIPPAADWRERVHRGVEASNAFVFVLSPDSLASKVCREELDSAVALNKRLVPVLRREVDGELPLALSRANWIWAATRTTSTRRRPRSSRRSRPISSGATPTPGSGSAPASGSPTSATAATCCAAATCARPRTGWPARPAIRPRQPPGRVAAPEDDDRGRQRRGLTAEERARFLIP